jgi:hypothetical protein
MDDNQGSTPLGSTTYLTLSWHAISKDLKLFEQTCAPMLSLPHQNHDTRTCVIAV